MARIHPAIVAAVAGGSGAFALQADFTGWILDLDAAQPGTLASGRVQSWPDQTAEGNDHDDDGETTRRPLWEDDVWHPGTGIDSVYFDGATDLLINETNLATDLASGTDVAFDVFIVGQFLDPVPDHTMWAMGNLTTIDAFFDHRITGVGPTSSIPAHRLGKRDDSNAQDILESISPAPSTARGVYYIRHTGTAASLRFNTTTPIPLVANNMNLGATTLGRSCVGGRFRGTATVDNLGEVRICKMLARPGNLAAADATALVRGLRSIYRC